MNLQTRGKIEVKLSEIDELLLNEIVHQSRVTNISLCGGISGISLYFYYRYKHTSDETFLDAGNGLIDKAIDHIESFSTAPYCGGVAGVGWLIEHLAKENFIEIDDEILNEMDASMLHRMNSDLHYKYYDFLHGAVGYGYYFLSRKKSKFRNKVLHDLVDKLKDIAVIDGKTVKWHDFVYEGQENERRRNRYVVDEDKVNLGLSHGIHSIMAFLAKLIEEDINRDVAKFLLEGSINFLLTTQIKNPQLSIYPYAHSKVDPGQSNGASRLGWCYGDLGIATTLQIAGVSLRSEKIIAEAERVMQFSLRRQNVPANRIVDCGLCHGSAGVAQIFMRFYWQTNNPAFKIGSDYWIDQSLRMAIHKDGTAGYKKWNANEGYTKDFGLLEGVAGIGLAFLSSLSDEPLSWDEFLLIS